MSDPEFYYLPKEVREGLERARSRDRRSSGGRLRVQVGDDWYPIRAWDRDGFEVALDHAPRLRGLVEIHDGPRMVRSALIVAGEVSGGTMRYGFKRVTTVRSAAPVDYVLAKPVAAGLLVMQ